MKPDAPQRHWPEGQNDRRGDATFRGTPEPRLAEHPHHLRIDMWPPSTRVLGLDDEAERTPRRADELSQLGEGHDPPVVGGRSVSRLTTGAAPVQGLQLPEGMP